MGYTTRNNGQITDFWPDDTENEIYIADYAFVSDIMERIKDKWPDANMDNIEISPRYIHTHCIYYDLFDPCDWTNFIVITRK